MTPRRSVRHRRRCQYLADGHGDCETPIIQWRTITGSGSREAVLAVVVAGAGAAVVEAAAAEFAAPSVDAIPVSCWDAEAKTSGEAKTNDDMAAPVT